MSDWPADSFPPLVTINPWSLEALGILMDQEGIGSGGVGNNSQTANVATFIPFTLWHPTLFTHMFWVNAGTVAGNVDFGVYTKAWTRIASTGATAMSGATSIQQVAKTLFLSPGQYYFAFAPSAGTATFRSRAPDADTCNRLGIAQQTSAHPLPPVATPATVSTNRVVPMCGISTRALV